MNSENHVDSLVVAVAQGTPVYVDAMVHNKPRRVQVITAAYEPDADTHNKRFVAFGIDLELMTTLILTGVDQGGALIAGSWTYQYEATVVMISSNAGTDRENQITKEREALKLRLQSLINLL